MRLRWARLIAATRPSPAVADAFDQELTVMVGCGFTPVLALRTIVSVGHYITGFVMKEQNSAGVPHGLSNRGRLNYAAASAGRWRATVQRLRLRARTTDHH